MLNKAKSNKALVKLLLILFCVSIVLPGMPLLMEGIIDSAVNADEEKYTVSDAVYKTVNYYVYNKKTLGTWEEVFAIDKLGILSDEDWDLSKWDEDQLDMDLTYAADYATPILALLSLGENPEEVKGRNLIQELVDKQKPEGNFGEQINDTYWAIIALEKAGASYDRVAAISYLASQQNSDGGFSYSNKGAPSGADTTGAALLALATFTGMEGTSECINKAIDYLNDVQMDDGAFAYGDRSTAESTALAIIGLVANGENITTEKWQKNGKTVIDSLMGFQLKDGSFSHYMGDSRDPIATCQALLALSYIFDEYGEYVVINTETGPGDSDIKSKIRVRIEGRTSTLFDEMVEVTDETTGIELLKKAIGEESINAAETAFGLFIMELLGEEVDGLENYWGIYTVTEDKLLSAPVGIGGLSLTGIDELLLHFKNGFITKDPKITIEKDGLKTKITVKRINETWIEDPDTKEWYSIISEEAVDGATVKIESENYIADENGQVSVQLPTGSYIARIEKQGETYPELIRYELPFVVEKAGEPGTGTPIPSGISVKVAVVGKGGELLFRPSTVKLSTNGNVLDALEATGLNYNVRSDGYVREIEGLKEREEGSQSGWKYKVNNNVSDENARDYKLKNSDRVIWWYALKTDETGPSWRDIEDAKPGETIKPKEVLEKNGDKLIEEQINKGEEVVISLEERAEPSITFSKAMVDKIMESNKPLIIKNAGAEICFAPQTLLTEEITQTLAEKNSEIKIEVKEIDSDQVRVLLEEVKEYKNGKFVDVGGKVYEFSFTIHKKNDDNSVEQLKITEFAGYLPIKIDLSDVKIKEETINNLTAVRYELDEEGNYTPIKLGGNYDAKEKTFTFYTDGFSLYGVVEAKELRKISLGINKPYYEINGVEGWTEVPPTILNGRTMVPIRLIAEALNAQVEWIEDSRTIIIKSGVKILSFTIGELLEGMDTTATIINSRTMVPLRYISEKFGARVMWFADSQKIEIIR